MTTTYCESLLFIAAKPLKLLVFFHTRYCVAFVTLFAICSGQWIWTKLLYFCNSLRLKCGIYTTPQKCCNSATPVAIVQHLRKPLNFETSRPLFSSLNPSGLWGPLNPFEGLWAFEPLWVSLKCFEPLWRCNCCHLTVPVTTVTVLWAPSSVVHTDRWVYQIYQLDRNSVYG